jgi:hypothetical protein
MLGVSLAQPIMAKKKKPEKSKDVQITRSVKREDERELWGKAAGRCQFSDCNKLLHKSPVTNERVNLAEMAHIYSFSPDGPRGRGEFKTDTSGLNRVENLILVCHDCHKKIDRDKNGIRYTAAILRQWKREHEARVRIAAGISTDKRSHVLLFGSRIGDESSPLSWNRAFDAMFPDWYPADDRPVNLSMKSALDDSSSDFWNAEAANLTKEFARNVRNRIEEGTPNHFSVFALASQPLLILLGSLLTDKVPTSVYQLHREPNTWKWQPHPEGFRFFVKEPQSKEGTPILLFSLSAKIDVKRVVSVVPEQISVWEITIDACHNDFLRSEAQLSMFRETVRRTLARISEAHPDAKRILIFPAMPVACAVEFGRIRMPKADKTWIIYDQNNKHGKFINTITIGTL